jgi:hypothetical protein
LAVLGLPSHDTFSRLFRLLDPEQFHVAFQRFMATFCETDQDVVAIEMLSLVGAIVTTDALGGGISGGADRGTAHQGAIEGDDGEARPD